MTVIPAAWVSSGTESGAKNAPPTDEVAVGGANSTAGDIFFQENYSN
jgi:hypothetical protein